MEDRALEHRQLLTEPTQQLSLSTSGHDETELFLDVSLDHCCVLPADVKHGRPSFQVCASNVMDVSHISQ
jgi:hypothetical protein